MAAYQHVPKHQLRISSYDRVSSWLVALLVVVGVLVACLMMIYFSRQLIVERFAVPLTAVQNSGGGGTGGVGAPGFGNDLEPPGTEEAPELSEPTIAETLSAVASAVATRSAIITDDTIDVGIE